jgi:hypothetical protein
MRGAVRRSSLAAFALTAALLSPPGASGAQLYVLPPCRLVDTRGAVGPRGGPSLAASATRTFDLTRCGVSPTAAAAAVNATVVGPTGPGYLVFYPAGSALPGVSSVNYGAGRTRANNAIVPLAPGALLTVASGQSAGTADLVVDVVGYFDDPANNQPPTVEAGGRQTVVVPGPASLTSVAGDDGKPFGTLTYAWTKASGPGAVTFGSAAAASTTATFSTPGPYVLRITVSDGALSTSVDVPVDVNPPPSSNPAADEARFLEQATWGPTPTDISHLHAIGMVAWLDEQFQTPPTSYPSLPIEPINVPPDCSTLCQRDKYTLYPLKLRFFTNALYGSGQLRQRVAFALHQLIVVSGTTIFMPSWYTPYLQILDRDAFGNYRQLLEEITLNPGMGLYLNMSTSTRNSPNENYAREIMQLFSVGVNALNPDGTVQLDLAGNPIPTYDQAAVTQLARVFTGWSIPGFGPGFPDFITPMFLTPSAHDTDAKTILGGTVLPAGQTGDQDLQQALDAIFAHPNVGPYVATHLIHNLVTSNPTPGYVARVAAAFADNGSGVRGDLQAVVTAILLDPEARGDSKSAPEYGHLKQPVLFLGNILRAFDAKSADLSTASDGYLNPLATTMSQNLFEPPNVFSYYPAAFPAPGTTLLGPEFGIFTATESLKRTNAVDTLVFAGVPVDVNSPAGTALDLSSWLPLASTPSALVSRMNQQMMHGQMSQQMQDGIVAVVSAVAADNPSLRVRQAAYLVASSLQYQVAR